LRALRVAESVASSSTKAKSWEIYERKLFVSERIQLN